MGSDFGNANFPSVSQLYRCKSERLVCRTHISCCWASYWQGPCSLQHISARPKATRQAGYVRPLARPLPDISHPDSEIGVVFNTTINRNNRALWSKSVRVPTNMLLKKIREEFSSRRWCADKWERCDVCRRISAYGQTSFGQRGETKTCEALGFFEWKSILFLSAMLLSWGSWCETCEARNR